MNRITRLALLLALFLPSLSLLAQQPGAQPVTLTVEVLNVYPHDENAFTQGLLLLAPGVLLESTGLRGQSSLREVDLETGEVLRRVEVRRPEAELTGPNAQPDYFAEGLELVEGRLIQLTWTAGEAFVYDVETFERIDTYTYEGEGWGLCYDGRYLYMSDGSPYISVREPATFELIVKSLVTLEGQPIRSGLLNELECVGDSIYANLWQTDFIVQLDKVTMQATALIDVRGMLPEEDRPRDPGGVLNGIAYNPESDTFYLTGKLWPKLFEVRFVPAQD